MTSEIKTKASGEVIAAQPEAKPAKAERKVKAPKPAKPVVAPVEAVTDDKAADKKARKDRKKAKKKEKKNKEAVIIRFDDEQIPQVDARAEALGLSRAAWVRMVVAQALAKG